MRHPAPDLGFRAALLATALKSGPEAGGCAVVCGELAGEMMEQFIDRRRNAVLTAEQDDLAVEVIGRGGSGAAGQGLPGRSAAAAGPLTGLTRT
jgi:hypothetical protein